MATNSCFGRLMEERDNLGFFKILRTKDLSSETMRWIPYDFIKTIWNKKISSKIVLRVPWGNSWPINLLRNPKIYYMEKNGWEQFLSDSGLGNDEFLTFTHKGNMCVDVNIYQLDGKEMLKPLKSVTLASSSSCRDKRVKGKNMNVNVKKEEAKSSSKSSLKTAASMERVQNLSLRNRKAKETEADALCPVPEFTLTIKKTYLVYLGVPRKFAEKHMPKKTTIFKIHHMNKSKSWEVTFKISDMQSRFSAGWIPLVKDLGLMVGYVCTFKLVKPTEMLLEVTRQKTPT